MFERLRDAINSVLDAASPGSDSLALMHSAVIDARAAIDEMRSQLARTEAGLERERRSLADAQRRGKLAGEIDDSETVEVAERFAAKHAERVDILERKLTAQREELRLAEAEFTQMRDQLKQARTQSLRSDVADRVETAWRDIEAAGGTRSRLDGDADVLRSQMDSASKEAMADEQLRQLKKKMGR